MYQDGSKNILSKIFIGAVLCLLLFFTYSFFRNRAGQDLDDESMTAIKEAIEKAALQCYVVEGAYPINLQYLKDKYGLAINEKSYYVVYHAYAENQLPDIRIVRK
ncbi:MAG: hypothetical protein II459_08075 [Erysipelotrichaceae bacterium]|nr:hypothetical protein [Erysipelotrichaceae bacterium]